jgi:anti-sigma B factor antagonist
MTERTFHLRGEYDLVNASELEASLLHFVRSGGQAEITIDAAQLRFIDSSGIGALLRVQEVMESEGRTLRVVNLPASTRRVLDVLDLTARFGVDPPGDGSSGPTSDRSDQQRERPA